MTLEYLIKRILLIIPTLFGIMLITFIIVQFAPGGPVEHILARINSQGLVAGDKGVQPQNNEFPR
jgi:microcin C transport system permease protein